MGQQRRQRVATWRRGLAAPWSRAAAVVCVCMVAAAAVAARHAVVTLDDGRRLEGELTAETDESVTLLIAGIPHAVDRDRIVAIDQPETLEEEYARREAAIPPGDLAARYQLAYWLFENRAYDEAEYEVNVLIDELEARGRTQEQETDADLAARASVLALAIAQRLKLMQDEAGQAPGRSGSVASADTTEQHGHARSARLTAEQINRIRLFEIDLAARPNVRVNRAVWDDLFTRYAGHPLLPRGRAEQTRMRAAEGWRQLQLIFDLRAREYYDQVQVLEDPPAMRTFRTRIHHRYVLNYCGTADCHGGTGQGDIDRAGGLELLRVLPSRDDTVYTNFYRLHTARHDDEELIDRVKPEESLLIQYGLPRDRALRPHPEAPGWRFGLRDESDPTYQLLVQWIARELYHPTPDYGIELPQPSGAVQPTVERP